MSSSESLREFISQRLTAAAAEIFSEFEKTIVQYEEEIDRQRRLLDITWRPQIKLQRTDLPHHYVYKEEDPTDQHLCHQERDSSLNQEEPRPPQIKEEQEELCTSQVGELLVLKQEVDTFMVTPAFMESGHSQREPKTHQIITQNLLDRPDQDGSKRQDSGATRPAELYRRNNVDNSSRSENRCNADLDKKANVKCDFCGKAFQYRSKMKRHSRVHTGEKPYTCNTCGRKFSHTSALNVHSRIHTGEKPYSCKMCGATFSHFRKLSIHMRIHAEEKPYSCNICGTGFTEISGLTGHMTTHANEKLYSCQTCGKSFRHSSTLTAHVRTHTGEKSYSCETCGKRFTHKGNLTAHIRTHTGEKPYSCQMCGKSFTQRSVLTVHIRTHTGEKPYSCEMCHKRFRHRSTLNLHMSTHTGEKL